jgi:membrane protease YdiL (CAAX protease family)
MLSRHSPLVTGLIIGLIWSAWHFPLHVTAFYSDGVIGFLFRFIYTIPFGIIFTWLYRKSGGNLFACILLHASINSTSAMYGANSGLFAIIVILAFIVAIVLYDRMYKKTQYPPENPPVPLSNPIQDTSIK